MTPFALSQKNKKSTVYELYSVIFHFAKRYTIETGLYECHKNTTNI